MITPEAISGFREKALGMFPLSRLIVALVPPQPGQLMFHSALYGHDKEGKKCLVVRMRRMMAGGPSAKKRGDIFLFPLWLFMDWSWFNYWGLSQAFYLIGYSSDRGGSVVIVCSRCCSLRLCSKASQNELESEFAAKIMLMMINTDIKMPM